MAPKPKPIPQKQITRPPISESSLVYTPHDALEGFEERVETGIDWTVVEKGARHHRLRCLRDDIPHLPFSLALDKKIKGSILNNFLDENSNLTLQEQWELMLPITLWDVQKFANEEKQACFDSVNRITDDIVKLIYQAVKFNDRNVLKKELKFVDVLRVNDSEMTEIDAGVMKYSKLVSLNLCGNFLSAVKPNSLPPAIKILELSANRINNIEHVIHGIPSELNYLGLSRNLLNNDSFPSLFPPSHITVLDLADNDIYHLEPVLEALLPLCSLVSLTLAGNPCSVCSGYAKVTLMKLPTLRWLDSREILEMDKTNPQFECHPDDLRSAYFHFTVLRIISVPQPPKPEKGATSTFHVELEIPLLDGRRRNFLMFRNNDSLIEFLPPPEDYMDTETDQPLTIASTNNIDDSTNEFSVYNQLTRKNSLEVRNFTTFESNRIQWNKVMNFQEPTVKIFCPDLVALRNTFRSTITVRLVYTLTISGGKSGGKKSSHAFKGPLEQRVVLASVKCSLRRLDWSQSAQHFHWDDTLNTDEAMHWGDGDLAVLQYNQSQPKSSKGKSDNDTPNTKQILPERLTCHFAFGIDTLPLH